MLESQAFPAYCGKPLWRRQSVSPVARGCEPGQVRKEAAAASESGAGVRRAGAVSSFHGLKPVINHKFEG